MLLMCLVLWCTHTKRVGVPYIYRGIAYDSRRGCGNTRVQWGAYRALTRKNHTQEQPIHVNNPPARSENVRARMHEPPAVLVLLVIVSVKTCR